MTSSNGNFFRVTGHLCGEFTGPGEFPAQRPVTQSLDVFFDLRLNKRENNHEAGDLRRYRFHYDVIVMFQALRPCLAPENPTLWRGVPVAPIQKSFGSSERDWKLGKKYRFLVNFAPTDSLHIPVLAAVRFASIRSWQICRIPTFLPPLWWIPPTGLLWFGHVNSIGIC